MSPRQGGSNTRPPRLLSIPGGCTFVWVSPAADAEAVALVARFPTIDGAHLDAMVDMLVTGKLRPKIGRAKGDYDLMTLHPIYELRIETTFPKLRLYFVERNGGHGLLAVGLLLATKPPGNADEQRRRQNEDIVEAWGRFTRWTYPATAP